MKGILSGIGNFPTYKDYSMTIPANAWEAGAQGTDSFTNEIFEDVISPDLKITDLTNFAIIPNGTTTSYLGSYGKLNVAESCLITVYHEGEETEEVGAIRFYALNQAPSQDINVTLRVYWY